MTYSATVYFLGLYRPYYAEAESLPTLVKRINRAIAEIEGHDWAYLSESLAEIKKHIRKRNCHAMSCERGTLGVKIKKSPHDPWLSDVVATLPPCPKLNYFA